jgi:hypothetical protein
MGSLDAPAARDRLFVRDERLDRPLVVDEGSRVPIHELFVPLSPANRLGVVLVAVKHQEVIGQQLVENGHSELALCAPGTIQAFGEVPPNKRGVVFSRH